MATVRYESFCTIGNRLNVAAKETARRLVDAIRILQDAEENYPSSVERYRAEVLDLKDRRTRSDGTLMQHVAHCTSDCKRAPTGDLAFAADNQAGMFDRAPTHAKPELPSASELAAMIDAGQTLTDLAEQYDRHPSTIGARLNAAGLNQRAKAATPRLPRIVHDEPRRWIADALCAQIDPEIFFPEKGGSTRDAKAVCAACPVQVECLDDALTNQERFGIWGGVSERTRRRISTTNNPPTTNTQEAS